VEIQSKAAQTWQSLDDISMGGVRPRWVSAGKSLLGKIEDDTRSPPLAVVGDRVDPGWMAKDFGSDDGDLRGPQE
jgi:hypothetical protein